KFVFADSKTQRIGIATDSMVSDGVIISGGTINRSVLHPRVRIHSYTEVDESVLMDGVDIGRHSKIRRTIIDKGVKVPPHTMIGYDLELEVIRSEEHTSELQSHLNLVCRLLLEKKN